MPRIAAPLVLSLAASVLAGCVYDPYTGTYWPCCTYYGYPYYRYPPAYYGYGYPYGSDMAPPQIPPGANFNPSAGQPPPSPGAAAYPDVLAQRFAAANVTHDGWLTREQAAVAMPLVAQNFNAIDIDRKGYVTLPEVRAFALRRGAELGDAGQPNVE
jgi:hypothetical protein